VNLVTVSGPLFDGRASAEAAAASLAAQRAIAAVAEKMVYAVFSSSIRKGTGRFLSSIQTVQGPHTFTTDGYSMALTSDLATDTIVTTDIASYGPWLEGVGSRNETTRFKGYHGYRQAAQQVSGLAEAIAAKAVAPYMEAMN
jgi:hypothetical protein